MPIWEGIWKCFYLMFLRLQKEQQKRQQTKIQLKLCSIEICLVAPSCNFTDEVCDFSLMRIGKIDRKAKKGRN